MLHKFVDKWPKVLKILAVIFAGGSVVYRAFLFVDDCIEGKAKKNVNALIVAIAVAVADSVTTATLQLCWPVALVFGLVSLAITVIDVITLAKNDEISFLTFKEGE